MPPPTYADLPAEARARLADGTAHLVQNPYETTVWRIDRSPARSWYLKAGRDGAFPSLEAERDRCLWLAAHGVPVPEVVDHGRDGSVEWLVTVELPGRPATDPEHLGDPHRTVPILAEGLRALHETPTHGCPFRWGVAEALDHVGRRVAADDIDPSGFHEVHADLTPPAALERLRHTVPGGEDPVLCHGDYCFPNALLEGGAVVGLLDLGEAGVSDRWRDLAVATWSCTWNLGPGYEDLFLEAYGTDWVPDRRDFFRLLYDLES